MKITRITLKSFLVSLLGILMAAEVDFSNGQQTGSLDHRHCYNITGGGEEICYFFVTNAEQNWNRAQEKCQNRSSSLPIIRNREEQTAIEEYFKHLKQSQGRSINDAWTSGKRKIYNDWTWINNNQTLNTTLTISSGSAEQTHMTIFNGQLTGREKPLKPENPVLPVWYLCQNKDRHCNGQQHEVNATNGCLIPSGYGNESWYEARNECLSNGGDLAVLTHQDQENLKSHTFPNNNYWIGLRKADWVWITSNKRKASPEEVKYTKWAYRQPLPPIQRDSCINIAANDGQWRSSDCNNTMLSVVCEQRGKTHLSTMISSTSRSSSKHSTTTQTTASTVPTRTDSNSTKPTTATTADSNVSVPIAVGAGAVIVILCIIVILVVICRKSKSSKNKTEPAQTDSETTKVKKPKEENPSATATEERSIYADIPLAERTANDTPAGQKGTVYASLDFNEGVTYAQPSKLYTNTQNASGPIYAEPLDANGNGTTSAGSSPTVKIGPMGDVYALPTTNVAPSSAKMTERPIYANT